MDSSQSTTKIFDKIRIFITDNFYIIFVLLSFLSFRFYFPESIRTVFWGLLLVLNFPLCLKSKGKVDTLIYLYILFGLCSIIGWIQRYYPFSFFLTVLSESYIPIIFYFVGRESSEIISPFYKRCLLAFLFVNVVGFILMYTMPSWYVERSLALLNRLGYYTEDTIQYARFASFLDSYHTANFSVFLLCISMGGSFQQTIKKKEKLLYDLSFYIAIIGILLSQQRVAMFIGIALLFLGFLFNKEKKGYSNKMLLLLLVGGVVLLLFYDRLANSVDVNSIFNRFSQESRSTIISSRSGTWINAIKNQRNFIFGHGLGGGGHLALEAGIKPVVTDGSYFVILLETGIFSLLTFLTILIITLKNGYFRRRTNYVDFTIVIYCICSLFGANVIYFPYIIGIMWYAIGRINRRAN